MSLVLGPFWNNVKSGRSLALLGGFAALSASVAMDWWESFDYQSMVFIQRFASKPLDCFVAFFSYLGSVELTLIVGSGICFWLWGRHSLASGASFALALGVITAMEVAGKQWIPHMPIPDEFGRFCHHAAKIPHPFYFPMPNSFPSGHMLRSALWIGTAAKLARERGMPKSVLWIAGVLIAMMAVTRIYIGDHWASDVAGGLLLARIGYRWLVLR